MGVRGLQTFLKNNPQLSEKVELNNSRLVIDANNLLCCLYTNMCLSRDSPNYRNDLYGGDMVAYAEIVKKFFQNLDRCGIVPILVFDGSVIGKQSTKDQLVLKEQTIYKRGLEKFEASKNATEDPIEDRINMPMIINHVFKSVASDFGIQRIQTPYEADAHIARIANEVDCPVLTNDSDFIIYKLKRGFIMLDLFQHQTVVSSRDGKPSILGTVFSQTRLIKCMPGLRPENMALLSVLLGNDYIEAGSFDAVLQSICGRHYNGVLVTNTFHHRRIANILSWLRERTLNEAIEYITNQIRPISRQKIEHVIRVLLKSYKVEETDNFVLEIGEAFPTSLADPQANSNPELMPAQYLRRLMEASDSNSLVLDVVLHNTHYNYPIIDDHQLPSSSFVKYRPLSVVVTLLRPRSYSNLTTYQRQVQSGKDSFLIYDRLKGEYAKMIIRPIDELDGFGSLEHLNCYTTITLEPALKKSLLMSTFRTTTDEMSLMTDILSQVFSKNMLQESCICLLLVKYIGIETKMSPKQQFVDALMLTMFFYAALSGQLSQNILQDPTKYGPLLLQLRPHSIKENGKRYEESQGIYRRIVHFISQLQCAYISYCMLNSLLNHVFQVPRYETFLNGTLIFRLTKLLRLGELKLDTICHGISPLLDACNSVRTLVQCD